MSEHLNDFSINILHGIEKKLYLVEDLIENQLDKIEKRLDKVEINSNSYITSIGNISQKLIDELRERIKKLENTYINISERIDKLENGFIFHIGHLCEALHTLSEENDRLKGVIKGKKCPICYGKDLCNPCKMMD